MNKKSFIAILLCVCLISPVLYNFSIKDSKADEVENVWKGIYHPSTSTIYTDDDAIYIEPGTNAWIIGDTKLANDGENDLSQVPIEFDDIIVPATYGNFDVSDIVKSGKQEKSDVTLRSESKNTSIRRLSLSQSVYSNPYAINTVGQSGKSVMIVDGKRNYLSKDPFVMTISGDASNYAVKKGRVYTSQAGEDVPVAPVDFNAMEEVSGSATSVIINQVGNRKELLVMGDQVKEGGKYHNADETIKVDVNKKVEKVKYKEAEKNKYTVSPVTRDMNSQLVEFDAASNYVYPSSEDWNKNFRTGEKGAVAAPLVRSIKFDVVNGNGDVIYTKTVPTSTISMDATSQNDTDDLNISANIFSEGKIIKDTIEELQGLFADNYKVKIKATGNLNYMYDSYYSRLKEWYVENDKFFDDNTKSVKGFKWIGSLPTISFGGKDYYMNGSYTITYKGQTLNEGRLSSDDKFVNMNIAAQKIANDNNIDNSLVNASIVFDEIEIPLYDNASITAGVTIRKSNIEVLGFSFGINRGEPEYYTEEKPNYIQGTKKFTVVKDVDGNAWAIGQNPNNVWGMENPQTFYSDFVKLPYKYDDIIVLNNIARVIKKTNGNEYYASNGAFDNVSESFLNKCKAYYVAKDDAIVIDEDGYLKCIFGEYYTPNMTFMLDSGSYTCCPLEYNATTHVLKVDKTADMHGYNGNNVNYTGNESNTYEGKSFDILINNKTIYSDTKRTFRNVLNDNDQASLAVDTEYLYTIPGGVLDLSKYYTKNNTIENKLEWWDENQHKYVTGYLWRGKFNTDNTLIHENGYETDLLNIKVLENNTINVKLKENFIENTLRPNYNFTKFKFKIKCAETDAQYDLFETTNSSVDYTITDENAPPEVLKTETYDPKTGAETNTLDGSYVIYVQLCDDGNNVLFEDSETVNVDALSHNEGAEFNVLADYYNFKITNVTPSYRYKFYAKNLSTNSSYYKIWDTSSDAKEEYSAIEDDEFPNELKQNNLIMPAYEIYAKVYSGDKLICKRKKQVTTSQSANLYINEYTTRGDYVEIVNFRNVVNNFQNNSLYYSIDNGKTWINKGKYNADSRNRLDGYNTPQFFIPVDWSKNSKIIIKSVSDAGDEVVLFKGSVNMKKSHPNYWCPSDFTVDDAGFSVDISGLSTYLSNGMYNGAYLRNLYNNQLWPMDLKHFALNYTIEKSVFADYDTEEEIKASDKWANMDVETRDNELSVWLFQKNNKELSNFNVGKTRYFTSNNGVTDVHLFNRNKGWANDGADISKITNVPMPCGFHHVVFKTGKTHVLYDGYITVTGTNVEGLEFSLDTDNWYKNTLSDAYKNAAVKAKKQYIRYKGVIVSVDSITSATVDPNYHVAQINDNTFKVSGDYLSNGDKFTYTVDGGEPLKCKYNKNVTIKKYGEHEVIIYCNGSQIGSMTLTGTDKAPEEQFRHLFEDENIYTGDNVTYYLGNDNVLKVIGTTNHIALTSFGCYRSNNVINYKEHEHFDKYIDLNKYVYNTFSGFESYSGERYKLTDIHNEIFYFGNTPEDISKQAFTMGVRALVPTPIGMFGDFNGEQFGRGIRAFYPAPTTNTIGNIQGYFSPGNAATTSDYQERYRNICELTAKGYNASYYCPSNSITKNDLGYSGTVLDYIHNHTGTLNSGYCYGNVSNQYSGGAKYDKYEPFSGYAGRFLVNYQIGVNNDHNTLYYQDYNGSTSHTHSLGGGSSVYDGAAVNNLIPIADDVSEYTCVMEPVDEGNFFASYLPVYIKDDGSVEAATSLSFETKRNVREKNAYSANCGTHDGRDAQYFENFGASANAENCDIVPLRCASDEDVYQVYNSKGKPVLNVSSNARVNESGEYCPYYDTHGLNDNNYHVDYTLSINKNDKHVILTLPKVVFSPDSYLAADGFDTKLKFWIDRNDDNGYQLLKEYVGDTGVWDGETIDLGIWDRPFKIKVTCNTFYDTTNFVGVSNFANGSYPEIENEWYFGTYPYVKDGSSLNLASRSAIGVNWDSSKFDGTPVKLAKNGYVLCDNGNVYDVLSNLYKDQSIKLIAKNAKEIVSDYYLGTDDKVYKYSEDLDNPVEEPTDWVDNHDVGIWLDETDLDVNSTDIVLSLPKGFSSVTTPDGQVHTMDPESSNQLTYTVHNNGSYVFKVKNKWGNVSKKLARVYNILDRISEIPSVAALNENVWLSLPKNTLSDTEDLKIQIASGDVNSDNAVWQDYVSGDALDCSEPFYTRILKRGMSGHILKISEAEQEDGKLKLDVEDLGLPYDIDPWIDQWIDANCEISTSTYGGSDRYTIRFTTYRGVDGSIRSLAESKPINCIPDNYMQGMSNQYWIDSDYKLHMLCGGGYLSSEEYAKVEDVGKTNIRHDKDLNYGFDLMFTAGMEYYSEILGIDSVVQVYDQFMLNSNGEIFYIKSLTDQGKGDYNSTGGPSLWPDGAPADIYANGYGTSYVSLRNVTGNPSSRPAQIIGYPCGEGYVPFPIERIKTPFALEIDSNLGFKDENGYNPSIVKSSGSSRIWACSETFDDASDHSLYCTKWAGGYEQSLGYTEKSIPYKDIPSFIISGDAVWNLTVPVTGLCNNINPLTEKPRQAWYSQYGKKLTIRDLDKKDITDKIKIKRLDEYRSFQLLSNIFTIPGYTRDQAYYYDWYYTGKDMDGNGVAELYSDYPAAAIDSDGKIYLYNSAEDTMDEIHDQVEFFRPSMSYSIDDVSWTNQNLNIGITDTNINEVNYVAYSGEKRTLSDYVDASMDATVMSANDDYQVAIQGNSSYSPCAIGIRNIDKVNPNPPTYDNEQQKFIDGTDVDDPTGDSGTSGPAFTEISLDGMHWYKQSSTSVRELVETRAEDTASADGFIKKIINRIKDAASDILGAGMITAHAADDEEPVYVFARTWDKAGNVSAVTQVAINGTIKEGYTYRLGETDVDFTADFLIGGASVKADEYYYLAGVNSKDDIKLAVKGDKFTVTEDSVYTLYAVTSGVVATKVINVKVLDIKAPTIIQQPEETGGTAKITAGECVNAEFKELHYQVNDGPWQVATTETVNADLIHGMNIVKAYTVNEYDLAGPEAEEIFYADLAKTDPPIISVDDNGKATIAPGPIVGDTLKDIWYTTDDWLTKQKYTGEFTVTGQYEIKSYQTTTTYGIESDEAVKTGDLTKRNVTVKGVVKYDDGTPLAGVNVNGAVTAADGTYTIGDTVVENIDANITGTLNGKTYVKAKVHIAKNAADDVVTLYNCDATQQYAFSGNTLTITSIIRKPGAAITPSEYVRTPEHKGTVWGVPEYKKGETDVTIKSQITIDGTPTNADSHWYVPGKGGKIENATKSDTFVVKEPDWYTLFAVKDNKVYTTEEYYDVLKDKTGVIDSEKEYKNGETDVTIVASFEGTKGYIKPDEYRYAPNDGSWDVAIPEQHFTVKEPGYYTIYARSDKDIIKKKEWINVYTIEEDFTYKNDETIVTFQEKDDSTHTYVYTYDDETGFKFTKKEDSTVTLKVKVSENATISKQIEVKVVHTDPPTIKVTNQGKVTIKPGAIKNDTLKTIYYRLNKSDWKVYTKPFTIEGTYTIEAYQVTKTYNVESDIAKKKVKIANKIPTYCMTKEIIKGKSFTLRLAGIKPSAIRKVTSGNKKIATITKDGKITGKKCGKTNVTCIIKQNNTNYKVKVNIHVVRATKDIDTNYNLKVTAMSSPSGKLPEYNVYKRVVKNSAKTFKFTDVVPTAKVKFYVPDKYKNEAKNIKIGKVKRTKNTAYVNITGKKKGFTHLTCRIKQNGHTYYTRLLIRVDDRTINIELNKYLDTKR